MKKSVRFPVPVPPVHFNAPSLWPLWAPSDMVCFWGVTKSEKKMIKSTGCMIPSNSTVQRWQRYSPNKTCYRSFDEASEPTLTKQEVEFGSSKAQFVIDNKIFPHLVCFRRGSVPLLLWLFGFVLRSGFNLHSFTAFILPSYWLSWVLTICVEYSNCPCINVDLV